MRLQCLHAWHHLTKQLRHEKHQRELQDEFDACTKEWDDQVAEKLREQKAAFEKQREQDRARTQGRIDELHKEVAESMILLFFATGKTKNLEHCIVVLAALPLAAA